MARTSVTLGGGNLPSRMILLQALRVFLARLHAFRKTKAKQPVRIFRFAKKVAATMSDSRKVGYIADKQENQLRWAGEQNTNMLHS